MKSLYGGLGVAEGLEGLRSERGQGVSADL